MMGTLKHNIMVRWFSTWVANQATVSDLTRLSKVLQERLERMYPDGISYRKVGYLNYIRKSQE